VAWAAWVSRAHMFPAPRIHATHTNIITRNRELPWKFEGALWSEKRNRMGDNNAAAPRGASPDDTGEDMGRFLLQLKDRVSAQKRRRQMAFERQRQALADAGKVREGAVRSTRQEMQKLEQKLRQLELENAADADRKNLLEANHDAEMRKLDRLLESCAVDRQPSALPCEVSCTLQYIHARSPSLHLEQGGLLLRLTAGTVPF